MRRGVWFVLVLMGGVPASALAQQQQQQREPPAEQARAPRKVSNEVLQQQIAEQWQAIRQLQGDVAQLRERVGRSEQGPAVGVGGSGRSGGRAGSAAQPGSTSQTGGAGQVGTAPMGNTAGMIIVEEPPPGQEGASNMASPGSEPMWCAPATGGSGMAPRSQAATGRPEEQIFVGTVRSVAGDRLIMVDPSHRVYEFGLGAQTRLIGPRGEAASPRSLRQGMRVRAVTREAGVRNEVRSLQILGPAPVQ